MARESIVTRYSSPDIPIRPTFSKSRDIQTNLYTSGGKYMILNIDSSVSRVPDVVQAIDYIGYYHVYKNGAVYSGRTYSDLSRKLEPYQHTLISETNRIDDPTQISESTKMYRLMTNRSFHNHLTPTLYIPQPEISDYKRGNIQRFFARRRTTGEIIEISDLAYDSANISNAVGIDQFAYSVNFISWSITGTAQQVREANQRVLSRLETDLPGITNYLSDPLEFWRGNDIIDDEYQYTTGGELRYADGRDYVGFYHILTDGTLKEGVRASSAERATLYRV